MPTYLHTIIHMELGRALVINSLQVLLFSLCIPLTGYLSDKIGRKPIIFTTAFLFIVFTYPLYTLLNSPNFTIEMIALGLLAILSSGIVGTVPSVLAEMFPTHVRYSGVAVAYNIGFAIFAGLTPIVATYLLYKLHIVQAPSFNLILSAIIAFIAAVMMKESHQKSLHSLK